LTSIRTLPLLNTFLNSNGAYLGRKWEAYQKKRTMHTNSAFIIHATYFFLHTGIPIVSRPCHFR
jgi:hypothetical protein